VKEILLDTSAYSAFMRGHEGVKRSIQEADLICVNPVVIGELTAGFRKGNRLRKNQAELREFLSSIRVDVIDIEVETAFRYATIWEYLHGAGLSIPTNDLWIAASAMQHGLHLVTLDERFKRVPQILVDLHSAA
jgi:predicted nucleic acid-binding protein